MLKTSPLSFKPVVYSHVICEWEAGLSSETYFYFINTEAPSFSSFLPEVITRTYLCNFDPLKPHFYIVKVGFTGVYIFFLFLLKT